MCGAYPHSIPKLGCVTGGPRVQGHPELHETLCHKYLKGDLCVCRDRKGMKLGRQGNAGAHGAPRIAVLFEMNKETFPEASDWERAGSEFFFKKKNP